MGVRRRHNATVSFKVLTPLIKIKRERKKVVPTFLNHKKKKKFRGAM